MKSPIDFMQNENWPLVIWTMYRCFVFLDYVRLSGVDHQGVSQRWLMRSSIRRAGHFLAFVRFWPPSCEDSTKASIKVVLSSPLLNQYVMKCITCTFATISHSRHAHTNTLKIVSILGGRSYYLYTHIFYTKSTKRRLTLSTHPWHSSSFWTKSPPTILDTHPRYGIEWSRLFYVGRRLLASKNWHNKCNPIVLCHRKEQKHL